MNFWKSGTNFLLLRNKLQLLYIENSRVFTLLFLFWNFFIRLEKIWHGIKFDSAHKNQKNRKTPPFLWEKSKPRSNPRFYFYVRAGHILFPFHYTIHFGTCQILVCVFIFLGYFFEILEEIYSTKKILTLEKICAYHSIPTPKSLRNIPYMGRKAKIFRALLHLEHTFRTHILFTFITYIYKLHL